jgi:drug/metabolite transporter (DMT)-like permease
MARPSALPYLLMLASSLSFAGMAALAHGLRSSCDWQVISLARVCLQLLFALVLAWAAGVRLLFWPSRVLWIRSISGSSALVCMFYAYTRIPASDVIVLQHTYPIGVALLSWPLLKQPPSAFVWLAVISSVVGVFLIKQPEWTEASLAYVAALLSSLFTAIAYIALHRLKEFDPRAVIVHFSAVSLVFCTSALFLFERSFPTNDGLESKTLLRLLGVGVTAIIAQLLLTVAMTAGPATTVSVVGLTQVVFAMGFDVLFFGYTFGLTALVGMALIAAPAAWLTVHRS